MNIPNEWIEEIYENVARSSCLPSRNEDIRMRVDEIIDMYPNREWVLRLDQQEEFKNFFIKIISHQANPFRHSLTCGVNSEHSLLLPRIFNHTLCLICPTCLCIQLNSPI